MPLPAHSRKPGRRRGLGIGAEWQIIFASKKIGSESPTLQGNPQIMVNAAAAPPFENGGYCPPAMPSRGAWDVAADIAEGRGPIFPKFFEFRLVRFLSHIRLNF